MLVTKQLMDPTDFYSTGKYTMEVNGYQQLKVKVSLFVT